MVVKAKIGIIPIRDEVHTIATINGDVWRKKYEGMPDASTEAVELQFMTPAEKWYMDEAGRRLDWSEGYLPPILVEVDLDELIRRGFIGMPEPIISGMDNPDRVDKGVMRCGDCGTPLKLGTGGVASCKNPECVRNKPASDKPKPQNA